MDPYHHGRRCIRPHARGRNLARTHAGLLPPHVAVLPRRARQQQGLLASGSRWRDGRSKAEKNSQYQMRPDTGISSKTADAPAADGNAYAAIPSTGARGGRPRIMSAAFSAIIMVEQ